MERKKYCVIQNEHGKFFNIDDSSRGYPYFGDDFEYCMRFNLVTCGAKIRIEKMSIL